MGQKWDNFKAELKKLSQSKGIVDVKKVLDNMETEMKKMENLEGGKF